jgi:dihydroorotate dehydrogenase
MPDWSYQTVFRPLLFRLPARTARRLTLAAFGAIGRLPGGAFLIKTLGHQEASPLLDTGWSPTPVGLSGLIDPAGAARQGLARLGFGFVEVGPVTPLPIESAEPIGLDARREILRFPEPYENSGLQETVRRLSRPGHRLPQYVRIAPMPGSAPDEAKPQLQRMMRDLAPAGAAGFYVDAAIPEWDDAECAAVLNGLASWMAARGGECRRPIFLYVPSDTPEEKLVSLLRALDLSAWSGAVLGNGRKEAGAAEKSAALRLLGIVRELAPADWIVKVGAGVHEPGDAVLLMRQGADAVLLGSGFVFAGPGLPKRINDAVLQRKAESVPAPEPTSFWRNWGWMYLLGFAMIVGGLAAWAIAGSTVLLPYDEAFLGMTRAELEAFNAHLPHFMSHDRITLAGTMISIGILYAQFASHGMREGLHWARTAVVSSCAVGFPSFFLYLGYGFFDPLHAAAAAVLLPMFLLSLRRSPDLPYRGPVSLANDRSWKRAMWGQLCFVALGAALAVGGLTIAAVGVTGVFVPTDLEYLGMTPGQLDAFNPRLIPLIAHDRAGFGGALFADAVAVLAAALWGIQMGNRWLWRTLLAGGAPAFLAALGVHFGIGYTDFVHLLPAWFACALYVAGLALLYPYMHADEDGGRTERPAEAAASAAARG